MQTQLCAPGGLDRGRRLAVLATTCTSSAPRFATFNYRDRRKAASALRPIYTAPNAEQALAEHERFDSE